MSGTPWQAYGLIVHLAKRLNQNNFGKTKLQKLVYLADRLKRVKVGYDFTFYTYGPFSSDLASDLDYVNALEGVKITHDLSINMYEIHPGDNADRLEAKSEDFLRENQQAIDEIVERFGDKQAKELELIATLVFVNNSGILEKKEIISKTKELKPRFSNEEVEESYELLTGWNYIHEGVQNSVSGS